MNVDPKDMTVRELTDGYEDKDESGVFGYGGTLDIRPPFQREFIYKDKQRDAVIDTVTKNFPLNVMYWAVRKDGTFEVIDGQQRTISICQYVDGDFAFKGRYFHNLQQDEKEQILNYKLMIYVCSGDDSAKLKWFETINIAGEKLTKQELRNAVFAGPWVSDAKRHFGKTQCPAYAMGGGYLDGKANRQDYLETVIKWISGDNIDSYMATNQHEPTANSLWLYFQAVIAWVKVKFTTYRKKEMKGVEWGELYNSFKDQKLDPKDLEAKISRLMEEEDVTNKKGVYSYVLDGKEKHLNIRAFTKNQKREAYERQKGFCHDCKNHFDIDEMHGDHITPWSKGGKTIAANCKMLCADCNRKKSGK